MIAYYIYYVYDDCTPWHSSKGFSEITYALKVTDISNIYPQHRTGEPYNLPMAITMLCTVYSCMKRGDVGPCLCLAFIDLVPL